MSSIQIFYLGVWYPDPHCTVKSLNSPQGAFRNDVTNYGGGGGTVGQIEFFYAPSKMIGVLRP